jgi:hypothetical protein
MAITLTSLFRKWRLRNVDIRLASIAIDESFKGSIIPGNLAKRIEALREFPSVDRAMDLIEIAPDLQKLFWQFSSTKGTEVERLEKVSVLFPQCTPAIMVFSKERKGSYLELDAEELEALWEERQTSLLCSRWNWANYKLFRYWLSQRSRSLGIRPVKLNSSCFDEFFDESYSTMQGKGFLRGYCADCREFTKLNEVSISSGDDRGCDFGYALGCSRGHPIYSMKDTVHFD